MRLEQQLSVFYQALAQGRDCSPAQLLKLECTLQNFIESGQLLWQDAQALVDEIYTVHCAEAVPELFWQWCLADGVFRLPYKMQVAPVK